MRNVIGLNFLAALAVGGALPASAANWPAWRGPDGNGLSLETDLPLTWSATNNVRWRVALPERGNSSPIVWNDRVFVTQAITGEHRRTAMCFDRATGKLLWQSGVTYTDNEPTQQNNGYCAATPVTDGERVVAWFGSAGLYCYDFAGKELWHLELGKLNHMHGNASSPVLAGDLCVVHFGPGENSKLIAVNKHTGKIAWEALAPKPDPSEQSGMGRGFGGPGGPGGPGGGRGGFGPAGLLAGQMFSQADKNGDGKVTKAELATLADAWFDKLDSAKAGKLTRDQFTGAFGQLLELPGFGPPEEGPGGGPQGGGPGGPGSGAGGGRGGFGPGRSAGAALFSAVDANHQGTVVREDLKATIGKWFSQWDTNQTGALTEDQLSAGLNAVLPRQQFARGGPDSGFGGPGGPGGPGGFDDNGGPGGPGGPGGGFGGPGGGRGGFGGFGGGSPSGSWSTPLLVPAAGHSELIMTFPNRVLGYNPATGKQLWFAKLQGESFYASPVFGDGAVVAMSSGMGRGSALALKPGGQGEATESQRIWRLDGTRGHTGSSVIWQGYLYSITDDGTAECQDLATGKTVWQQRLRGSSGRGSSWSSIVLAAGNLYVPNQSGDVFVVKASPTYELLATNSVKERTNASLAVSDGQVFLRTEQSLWCFAQAK